MPSFATLRPMLFAALGLALAVAAAVVWRGANDGGAAMPGATGSPMVVRPETPVVRPAGAATPTSSDAGRVAPPTPCATLRGRLTDAAGVPIGGLPIEIDDGKPRVVDAHHFTTSRGQQPSVGPRERRITAEDGTFDFAELAPGTYSLRSGAFVPHDSERTLAAGDHVFVELRLPPTLALVAGTVHLAAMAPTEAMLSIVPDANQDVDGCSSSAGDVVRHLLPPGRYQLRTWSKRLGPRAVFARQTLLVPDGVARIAFAMAFGGTPIEVVVHGECACGRDGIGIDVNGSAVDQPQVRSMAVEGRLGAAARFVLPAGTWRITVSGPGIAVLPEHVCAIEPDTAPIRIEHEARPGAVVRLEIVDARDEPVWVAPELLPSLFAQGSSCACVALDERTRARPVGYRAVPLGPALLQWEDRVDNGARTFLPFDPLPPLDLVVAAEGNVVPLVVQRRPWVDLRACDRSGREDCYAKIAVFAGAERVRGRDEEAPQRWSGWLPPGDYRVVVERSAGASERLVTVGRGDLTLRLRP